MTVTLDLSPGPKLDRNTELGVHIIKLPSRDDVVTSLHPHPSEKEVMDAAATLAGPAHVTDIVVFDHKPWHKVHGELHAHPKVHDDYPETILQVSFKDKERAVWWSDRPFTVMTVRRSDHHPVVAGCPDYPFDGPPPPYDAQPEPDASSHATVFVVKAHPIVKEAVGQLYKISFLMGEPIDPDMSCTP